MRLKISKKTQKKKKKGIPPFKAERNRTVWPSLAKLSTRSLQPVILASPRNGTRHKKKKKKEKLPANNHNPECNARLRMAKS
jgi:hypothetical protein